MGLWLRAGSGTPLGRIIILLTLLMMVMFAAGYLYVNVINFQQIENSDKKRNLRNDEISLLIEAQMLMEQSFGPAHDILLYGMLLKSGILTRAQAENYVNIESLTAERGRSALQRFLSEKGGGLPSNFRQGIATEAAEHGAVMEQVREMLRRWRKGGPSADIDIKLDTPASFHNRHDELGKRISAEMSRLKIEFDHFAEADFRAQDDVRSKAAAGVVLIEAMALLLGLMELAAAGRAALAGRILEEEREKYKKLMEHAGDAVIVTDADTGLMVEINRKGEELLGMRRGDVVGQPHDSLFPPTERERYNAMLAKRVADGPDDTDPNPKSITLIRADGVAVTADVRCSMIRVEGRDLMQGIYRDMTTQRAHEKLMEQQAAAQMELVRQTVDALEEAQKDRKAAEEANRLKSEFVANMSHELRTPLTSVLGYSRIARERMEEVMEGLKTAHRHAAPDGERVPAATAPQNGTDKTVTRAEQAAAEITMFNDVVVAQGERLLQLINDLLDMSSLEAGQLKMQEHVSSARMILHAVSARLAAAASEKNIRLAAGIDNQRNEDIFFLGDTSRIEQTLYNLVQNAIKYSGGGEVRATASISNGQLYFRVKDEGIGIPAKDREIIFDAFRQLDGGSTRAQGGVGLGLTLCRKLVAAMGGTISVQSTEGKGSEFTITLPYRPVDN